jgi:hypothetical protein
MLEALDAFEAHPEDKSAAARSIGIDRNTFTNRLQKAQALGREGLMRRLAYETPDPAIADSMKAVGTSLVPKLAWAKTRSEDGTSYSVLLKPQEMPEETLDRIREAFEGMAPAAPVIPPEKVAVDLCNVIPLYDVHWGMHAWGAETGGDDYDLKHAEADMKRAFEGVLQLIPQGDTAVLLIGGDFYHADDNTAQTPASKHSLDVDGRMHKVIETSIAVLSYVIQRLLERHMNVMVRVLRGNHDEHSHLVLKFALDQRYREEPRVTVDKSPRDLFMFQWGRVGVFGHHGDKGKPVDFVLKLADVCPFWTATPHRHAYTGHFHRMEAQRIGGLAWERLDAFAPPDSYGSTWAGRRVLKADTYHKRYGRVLTAFDPIERT